MRLLLIACAALSVCAQQRQAPPKAQTEMERAVEEFKIQTRELGIEAGRSSQHRRAGGPKGVWHGRVYENLRNDFLDALPHEIAQRGGRKSLLRRNQFGFSVAGPLSIPGLLSTRNRTFLSVSYEGVRERISRSYLRTIPTLEERSGDFSPVVDQAGNPLPIFDPQSTRANPEFDASRPVARDNLQYGREPFPGNRIPGSRLDPVAQRAMSLYPAPNAAVGPFFRNNYFIHSPERDDADGMIAKLDQSLGDRHRLALELAFSDGFLGAARWFASEANPGPADRLFHTRRGALEHTFTATPETVNTARFTVTSQSAENAPGDDTAALPGWNGSSSRAFPVFLFSPYLGMGRAYPLSRNVNNRYAGTEGLSTRHGEHTLRLVLRYARYQVNTFGPQYPSGSVHFSEGLTSLPGIVNTGHAFASFLLGLSDFAERSIVLTPSYFRRDDFLAAIRDHYEVRKGLTLDFGLNFERATPRVEKFDRQSTIDLRAFNPVSGRAGALIAAGRNGRAFQPARPRLEPSLGLAWNPRGDPKTVVRAAFSRSYSAIPIYANQWGTQGFSAYPTSISPNIQIQPALVLSQGLPAPSTTFPDLRPEAANDTVADLFDPQGRLPTYQSASLTYERELRGSLVLTVGLAYAGGRNLLVGNSAANPNAIPLEALRFRDRLNDDEFNRSLRPYPQFKGFDVGHSYPLGRYQRRAGFLRLEKRASQGLTLSATYELARQMDDYSGPYGKQDFFHRENEWSLTPGSVPQRLDLSYTWELPFGAHQRFLHAADWRRYLLDGWSVIGVASIASGNPLYLRPEFNNTGGVVQALHVNVVPGEDPHAAHPGPELWFNPAAFDQPADFTLGNAPRTHATLRNPGDQNYDLALNKRIALAGERTLELSASGFNFINHGNWNDPDNVIGPLSAPNINAGHIIGSRGGRVIQVGVRFSF